uniref:Putative secreted protein n=1 Tax=Anopheles darlingi TaxID=43151 RepID=A0A2M4D826_ANODA
MPSSFSVSSLISCSEAVLARRLVSPRHLLQKASVWMAMAFAWNSQFGFVTTPRSSGISSGDRPEYGPRKTRF